MDEAAGSSVDHPYPHLHRRLHDTQVAVGTFISGTLLYVLSRQWQDLLAVNVFHLHPLPFCDTAHGNLSQLPCTPEAGSGVQFLFAAGMLCVAAVVQHVSLRNEARWPSLTIVPLLDCRGPGHCRACTRRRRPHIYLGALPPVQTPEGGSSSR